MRWLVSDQLGTPRMVVERSGSLAGMTRHDYLPFGEELSAGAGGRTTTQGYGAADNVRQKFTGYVRDTETRLDYAQSRYFASLQGRFMGVDPLLASGRAEAPQTWNRYAYALNNPLRFTDPTGMAANNAAADLQKQQKQQPPQPQLPKPKPALVVSGPANPVSPQEDQLLQNAHSEAQTRVQNNSQCADLLGGLVAAMDRFPMIFVLDRSLTGKPKPQAYVEEVDGEPTGRFGVNPTGALMRPPGSTHQFTLLESPGERPSTLTLSGAEAGAFVILHEQAHPAGSFGSTDVDNPIRPDGSIDQTKLANNYINNYKVWKSCFPDRKPVPNSSNDLPQ